MNVLKSNVSKGEAMLLNSGTVQRRSKKTVGDGEQSSRFERKLWKSQIDNGTNAVCTCYPGYVWQVLTLWTILMCDYTAVLPKSLQRITYPETISKRSCVLPNVFLENCWHNAGTALLAVLKIHNPPPSPSLSLTHCEFLPFLPSWLRATKQNNTKRVSVCPSCKYKPRASLCVRRQPNKTKRVYPKCLKRR